MTWISMSCRWPLCPTLPLHCIYLHVHTHTPICTCTLFTIKHIAALLLWHRTVGAVFICSLNNSTKETQCWNVSACHCKHFCNLSPTLSGLIRRDTVHLRVSEIKPGRGFSTATAASHEQHRRHYTSSSVFYSLLRKCFSKKIHIFISS